jgi:hypothetical protein
VKYPTISNDPAIQAHYERSRAAGSSHKFAEMVALAQPPGISGTDSVFLEGHCNGNQFANTPEVGEYYRSVAEAAGVSTEGKVYKSGLANYPGDPKAWVSGRGDVLRVVRERNWSCEGAVRHDRVRGIYDGEPDVPLADDLVDAFVEEAVREHPERGLDLPKLRREIIEKHGYKKDPSVGPRKKRRKPRREKRVS